ncbi:MAG: hypothetical protein AABX76_02585 [Nanoarchaeota archaeon]
MELTELLLAGEKIMTTKGSEVKAKPIGNPFCVKHTMPGRLKSEIECVVLAIGRKADGYSVGAPEHCGENKYTPVQLYKILR